MRGNNGKPSSVHNRVLLRREKVAQWMRDGVYSAWQIAQRLLPKQKEDETPDQYLRRQLSLYQCVKKDQQWVRAAWKRGMVQDYNTYVVEQEQALYDAIRRHLADYEKSLRPRKQVRSHYERVKVRDEVRDKEGRITQPEEYARKLVRREVVKEEGPGDTTILEAIRRCRDDLAKLRGLGVYAEQDRKLELLITGDPKAPLHVRHHFNLEEFLRIDPNDTDAQTKYLCQPRPAQQLAGGATGGAP
jgi:hypothetical protein